MSLNPDSPTNVGQFVAELSDELSRIRARGIDAVVRSDSKQKPLKLPRFTSIVDGSPWAEEPLPVAVRRIIARSIPYCESPVSRQALPAFYGIGTAHDLSADERQRLGHEVLRTPKHASSEYKKIRIREIRLELARAILAASAADFEPPTSNAVDLDVDGLHLPEPTRIVLGELLSLREGRGVTPVKIDQLAPSILELDCVRDHYIRSSGSEEKSDCAVEVLRCASRAEPMRGLHGGRLVAEMLNLRQTVKPYETRKESYQDAAKLSEDEFTRLEVGAFVRFAKLLIGLTQSPCIAEVDNQRGNRNFAQNMFGLLERLSTEDRVEVCVQLVSLIEASMPGFRSSVIKSKIDRREAATEWLSVVFLRVAGEYAEWARQYISRIDQTQRFLDITQVQVVLTAALTFESQQDVIDAREAAGHMFFSNTFSFAEGDLDSYLEGTLDSEALFTDAFRSSLILLAQLLAYNEVDKNWESAVYVDKWRDSDKPLFPIVPFRDFDHEDIHVDTGS